MFSGRGIAKQVDRRSCNANVTGSIPAGSTRGRLVSGQKFAGKVNLIATDYFQIVELEVENSSGKLERVDLDIVKMRFSAVMYFGHK